VALCVGFHLSAILRPDPRGVRCVEPLQPSPGQDGCAQRRLLAHRQRAHGKPKHVRHDLLPDAAGGAAPRKRHDVRPRAQLRQHAECIVASQRHTLQHGTRYLLLAVLACQAQQHAACIRVHMRRPFAGKIRQEKQPACARRDFPCPGRDSFVVIPSGQTEHILAQPAQRQARRQNSTHLIPARALFRLQRAAKRVRPAQSIHPHLGQRLKNLPAAAQGHEERTGVHHTCAQRAARRIGCAGHNRYACGQPHRQGGLLTQQAGYRARGLHGRQPGRLDARQRQQVGRPIATLHIQQQRAGAVAGVRSQGAGHAPAHIVLGQQHMLHLPPQLGAFLLQPEHGGGLESGRHGTACQRRQAFQAGLRCDFLHLACTAPVRPDDGGSQGVTARAKQHRAMHLT